MRDSPSHALLSAGVWVPGSSMCQATGSSRECPRLHCCEASRTSRCRKLAAVRPDTRSLCMKSSEWPLRSRLFSRPVRPPHQQLSAVMREFLQRPPSPNRTVNVSLLRNELGSALTIFLRSQPYRMCDVDEYTKCATTVVERLSASSGRSLKLSPWLSQKPSICRLLCPIGKVPDNYKVISTCRIGRPQLRRSARRGSEPPDHKAATFSLASMTATKRSHRTPSCRQRACG